MKIVAIFAEQIFAFHYANEAHNEYERLMELWTDVAFLKDYANKNNVVDIRAFVKEVVENAEQIQDFLENLSQNNQPYGCYFEPLQDAERNRLLAFQKGKIKKSILRYYAIKLDDNCFVITGGAIKMSQTMQEHPDTNNELNKLKEAREYLKQNGVFDEDSFFELLIEQ
jgi:hypothetical protein